jgi:hypothetical protein
VAAAVLVVVTLIAYLPAFRGGFIFDDNVFLTANPLIAAPDGLWRFWFSREAADYWPVTASTLWLEWRLWGMNATGYHATNVILHIGEILLLWAVLCRLHIPGAFFGALIFAVHPLNAESVAWITQRKNLMAMLFYLLSIYWFCGPEMDRRDAGAARGSPKGPKRSSASLIQAGFDRGYWLSLFAFILGMLSKGSVVFLPLVLLGCPGSLRVHVFDGRRTSSRSAAAMGRTVSSSGSSTVVLFGEKHLARESLFRLWIMDDPFNGSERVAATRSSGSGDVAPLVFPSGQGPSCAVCLGLFVRRTHPRPGFCGSGVHEIFPRIQPLRTPRAARSGGAGWSGSGTSRGSSGSVYLSNGA